MREEAKQDTRETILWVSVAIVILIYAWMIVRNLQDLSRRLEKLTAESPAVEMTTFEPPPLSMAELALATEPWFGGYTDLPSPGRAVTEEVVIAEPSAPPVEAPPVVATLASQPVTLVLPPVAAVPVQTPPKAPEQKQFDSAPHSSIQLTGIVLGARVREVVVAVEGQKQQMGIGAELSGWRLVEINRFSAVFESPAGDRRTVHLYPNVP